MATNGIEIFKRFGQVYENFQTDTQVKIDNALDKFYQIIDLYDGPDDEIEFKKYCNENFLYQHKCTGRKSEKKKEFTLGHIKLKSSFCSSIRPITPYYNCSQIQEMIENYIESPEKDKPENLMRLKRTFHGSQFGGEIVWSFVNDDRSSLEAIGLDMLSCRLGLEDIDKPKFFIEHNYEIADDIKIPTAFDAGFNEYWRPGGVTLPRSECVELRGCEEVVHPRNSFYNIIQFDRTKK